MIEKIKTPQLDNSNNNLPSTEGQVAVDRLPARIIESAQDFGHEYVRIHYNFNSRSARVAYLYARGWIDSLISTRFSGIPTSQGLLTASSPASLDSTEHIMAIDQLDRVIEHKSYESNPDLVH